MSFLLAIDAKYPKFTVAAGVPLGLEVNNKTFIRLRDHILEQLILRCQITRKEFASRQFVGLRCTSLFPSLQPVLVVEQCFIPLLPPSCLLPTHSRSLVL